MTATAPLRLNHSRLSLVHVSIILLSLLMTISAWWLSKAQIDQKVQIRFNTARDQTLDLILERMKKYEDSLWSGVAAMDSHGGEMTHAQWQRFAHSLRIEEKYPGINGIGVIEFVRPKALSSYLEKHRATRPQFDVFPKHAHQQLLPITYIEPLAINIEALGLDIAHENNRRIAALTSRDSGQAKITGPIVLVQDQDHTPGFLFYAPYYRNGTPDSLAKRRMDGLGVVYAPFVMRKLMDGLLSKAQRNLRISITDAGQTIYDEHQPSDPSFDPNPMFRDTVNLDLYGRRWVVDVRSDLTFRAQNTYGQPLLILIGGLIIEALIISMIVMMARTNARAISYADRATATLRRKTTALFHSNAELAKANGELQRFIDTTSFDLKTAVNKISQQTEALKRDFKASPPHLLDAAARTEDISEQAKQIDELLNDLGTQHTPPQTQR